MIRTSGGVAGVGLTKVSTFGEAAPMPMDSQEPCRNRMHCAHRNATSGSGLASVALVSNGNSLANYTSMRAMVRLDDSALIVTDS